MRIKQIIREAIIIIIVCLLGTTTSCATYYEKKLDKITLESVQEFDISQEEYYLREIENSEDLDIYLGAIESPEDLMKKGEALWIQMYGEKSIESDKPYRIFYDEKEDIWLIQGEPGYEIRPIKRWIKKIREKISNSIILGGSEYIIVQGGDGKVLAVWREF